MKTIYIPDSVDKKINELAIKYKLSRSQIVIAYFLEGLKTDMPEIIKEIIEFDREENKSEAKITNTEEIINQCIDRVFNKSDIVQLFINKTLLNNDQKPIVEVIDVVESKLESYLAHFIPDLNMKEHKESIRQNIKLRLDSINIPLVKKKIKLEEGVEDNVEDRQDGNVPQGTNPNTE